MQVEVVKLPTSADDGEQAYIEIVHDHVWRYFTAKYGSGWEVRTLAVEDEPPNLIERWMHAIATGELERAEDLMAQAAQLWDDYRASAVSA